MIKTLKKPLAYILSAAMLMSLQSIDAYAVGDSNDINETVSVAESSEALVKTGTCGENAVWTLDEATGVLTISGTGAMTDYDEVKSPWNQDRKIIQSIVVEDGITHIGNKAFSYVDQAKSVVLADSVTSLGDKAFSDDSELEDLSMPGVETIGNNCFWGCSNLTSFEWPEKLREIGEYAFYRCEKLKDPVFTENLTSIGQYAFIYCDGIENVTIPASLTDVGYYVFDSCEGLKHVTFAEGASTMNGFMFRGCSSLEEVVLPDGLKKIPEYAFADCISLRWVWIPDSVTEIERCAFEACSGLTRVAIPKSVKKIIMGAFGSCFNLQSAVYFGTESDWKNVLIWTGNEALTDLPIEYDNHRYTRFEIIKKGSCTESKEISYIADDNSRRTETIPAIGHQYENDVCVVCGSKYITDESLIDHGYCNSNIEWRLRTDGTLIVSGQGVTPNYGARKFAPWYDYHDKILQIIVEEGITGLGSKAFAYCNYMTKLVLPDSITEIGEEAFDDAYVLKDVKLPGKLKIIGDKAFFNCHSLPEIEFPDSLESIGKYAFQNCKALKELNLPASVHTIDSYAFQYCDGLTDIVFPEGLESLGDYSFEGCRNLKSVHLPESLTYLGMYAFRGCPVLVDVNIPIKVPAILQNTFEQCDSLAKIEIPENVKRIDKAVFFDCDNLTDAYVYAKDCKLDASVFKQCSPDLVIRGMSGSTVEAYAAANNLKFESIGGGEPENPPVDPVDPPVDPVDPPVDPVDPPVDPVDPPVPDEEHHPVKIPAKTAGCVENGNKEYWHCTVCDKYFKDEACTKETKPESEMIKALGHSYKTTKTRATTSKNGSIITSCTRCGKVESKQTIYYPKTISLSATHYTYTGKVITPTVTVKGSDGKTIKSSDNYTVSYASGRKNIGRYAVKVTFKGNYTGDKTFYFEIGPKNPTTVKTYLYGHDDVKVSWSRVSGASGYKVYYKKSTAGSYTYLKTTTGTSYAKANLADGTKYTFKVVAYKTINGNRCENAGKTSSIYTLKKLYTPIVSRYGSKVKVKWSNIAGESGYQISRSTSKTGTYIVSTYATTAGTYRYVSATKGKYYYYKVRAYRQVGSKKIYGPWSTAVRYKR